MRWWVLALSVLAGPSFAQPYIFKGEFTQVAAGEAAPCSTLFSELHYRSKFFFLEPGRKAIVHFESQSPEAILNGLTLVGRVGYGNEIQVDKRFQKDGLNYYALADGLVSRDLLLLTLQVTVKEPSGADVCTATAEYSGFPE